MKQVTRDEAIRRLMSAVILDAVKHLDSRSQHLIVNEFFESEWFDDVAKLAGFDEKEITTLRRKARTGNFDQQVIRAAYR